MKYIGNLLKILFLGFVLTLFANATLLAQNPGDISGAQVPSVQDTLSGWVLNWVTGLNVSQAADYNWSHGGVNSLSLTSSTNISLMYQSGQIDYDLLVLFRYGQGIFDDEGLRETDDQ